MRRILAVALLLVPALVFAEMQQSAEPLLVHNNELAARFEGLKAASQRARLEPASHGVVFASIFVISIVGNTPGSRGTYFKSDLIVYNARNADQETTFYYFPANTKNSSTALYKQLSIPAGGVVVLEDVVGQFFGASGLGSIVVQATQGGNSDSEGLLSGFSRIWTPAPGCSGGTASQSFPAVSANELLLNNYDANAIGARQDANFRANIGIFNFSANDETFTVNVRPLTAGSSIQRFTMTVPSFSVVQQALPAAAQGNLFVWIERIQGADFLYNAYVSTTDNNTGDSWSANLVQ